MAPVDQLAIETLYARYNRCIEGGDAEGWARCFDAAGTFSNARGRYEGRAALTAYAAGWIGDGGVRYWIDNLVLAAGEAEGTARGTCYLAIIATGATGQPPAIQLTGRYTDILRRGPDGWTFVSRHIARD